MGEAPLETTLIFASRAADDMPSAAGVGDLQAISGQVRLVPVVGRVVLGRLTGTLLAPAGPRRSARR